MPTAPTACSRKSTRRKLIRLSRWPMWKSETFSITSPPTEVEVIKTLKELGAKNIYSFVETLHKFPALVEKCVKFTKTWY